MNGTCALPRAAMFAAITFVSHIASPMASANSAGGAGIGLGNTAAGPNAFVGGGFVNTASGFRATIGGGEQNRASEIYATIGGGFQNTNSGHSGTIGGGFQNTNGGLSATIGGGRQNRAGDFYATIGGGRQNTNVGNSSTIGGGYLNTASDICATIGGGQQNNNRGSWATIGGGFQNTNTAVLATIGGGRQNTASGQYATVPGGVRGKATNVGSFVWSGVETVDTISTNNFSFTVRAPGGVRFITAGNNSLTGVRVLPNATSWTVLSDRESKTDFQPIKPREVLAKLASMPVSSWKYKHDPSRRYIGPTSQDFMEAFHLGDYDKGINTLDADGVTFAAIKGLVEELKERDKTVEELKSEMRVLREELRSSLPPKP